MNGTLSIGASGGLDFVTDRKRSNKTHFDAFWAEPKPARVNIVISDPIYKNEAALRVGYLTAAYALWFKVFGYSFALQKHLDIVREQILNPHEDIMDWNYLFGNFNYTSLTPSLSLLKFGSKYFPAAHIYDQHVILPIATDRHPPPTEAKDISVKSMNIDEGISPRLEHKCIGPAIVICDHQILIHPDFFNTTTVSPQYIWLDGWS